MAKKTDQAPRVIIPRTRPALVQALRLIVEEGKDIAAAAKAVGYQTDSLVRALKRPDVIAERARIKRAQLESQTDKAWLNVFEMAGKASSEDVKLKACRTIINAAGELDPKDLARVPGASLVQIVMHYASSDAAPQPAQRLPGVIEAPSRVILRGSDDNA